MSTVWRDLVAENPMTFEITRFLRRFFSVSRGNTANLVAVILIAIFYLVMLTQILYYRSIIEPWSLGMFQVIVYALIIPPLVHSVIAGEKERRSWEMLVVAPVTKAQIVVGKFLMSVVVNLAIAVLFIIPLVLTTVRAEKYEFGEIFRVEILSILYAMAASALVLRISASSRRVVTALAASFGAFFFLLVVVPALVAMFGVDGKPYGTLLALHPVFAVAPPTQPDTLSHDLGPIPATLIQGSGYIVLTVVLLASAVQAISKPESEVLNNPRSSDA